MKITLAHLSISFIKAWGYNQFLTWLKRETKENCFKIGIISIIVLRLKDDLFNKGVKGQKLKKRHLKLLL